MRHSIIFIGIAILFLGCKTTSVNFNSSKNEYSFKVCEVDKPNKPFSLSDEYSNVIIHKAVHEQNDQMIQDYLSKLENNMNIVEYEPGMYDKLEDIRLRKGAWKKYLEEDSIYLRKIEAYPRMDKRLISGSYHPFMHAMHMAYAEHYPLRLSPDMIWLLIAQGFANHVSENSEELRYHFVDFEGRKVLKVYRTGFKKGSMENNWPGVFAEFSEQIEKNTGPDLLELVTGDFSTTGPVEKAAFQVTLMDAMESYFIYAITSICGIPEITLEGTVEDWEKIEEKTQALAQYDLETWVGELMPVLKEFTKAAKGEPNKEFWKSIYKWNKKGSGGAYITGWILRFFPYLKIGGNLQRVDFQKNKNEEGYNLRATTNQFPSGISSVDLIWDYHGTFYKMDLTAGFFGTYQDPDDFSLRPEISWAVVDKQTAATDEEKENYEKGGDKDYLDSIKK